MPGSFPSETLRHLRSLEFINKANFRPARAQEWDGVLVLRAAGKPYEFLVEVKRSYLDRSTLNAVIAQEAQRSNPEFGFKLQRGKRRNQLATQQGIL